MGDSKKSAWEGYRKWRKVAWAALPITIYLFTSGGSILFALPLFVISAMAVIFIQFFECPKCDEPFFYISGLSLKYSKFRLLPSHHPFTQTCVHCGFPKWEEPSSKAPKVESYPIPRAERVRPNPAVAERLRLTNFLTIVLHDDPGAIGLRLDPEGWVDADHLIARANRCDVKLTRESLGDIACDSKSDHFDWDSIGNRVRWRKS